MSASPSTHFGQIAYTELVSSGKPNLTDDAAQVRQSGQHPRFKIPIRTQVPGATLSD